MKGEPLAFATALALFCGSAHVQAAAADADADADAEMAILARNYISEHPGVSIDAAITRLNLQGELNPAFEDLSSEFADRLCAISLRHSPDQHIFVELIGTKPVPDRVVKTQSGTARVVFEIGNLHTAQEFHAILERNTSLIHSVIPGITGVSGYPGDNRVLILIEGDTALAGSLDPQVKLLEQTLGMEVAIEPNHPRSRNAVTAPGR